MDSLKKVAKSAAIVFLGLFLSKFLTYLYRIITARIGVEEYGLLSLGLAVFGTLGIFSVIGLNVGVVRYVAYYKARQEMNRVKGTITSSLKIGLTLSLILAGIMFFGSGWISLTFFHTADASIILKILAIGLPFYTQREILFAAIKAYSERADYETYSRSIGENLVKVIVTLVLLTLGYGVIGSAYAYLLAIIATFFISLYILEKQVFPIVKTRIISIKDPKEIVYFSLPVMFSSLINQVIVWSGLMMMGYYRNASEVGVYNVALPTATLLSIVPEGIITLLIPILCGLYIAKKTEEFAETLRTSIKWVYFLNLPILAIIIIFGDSLLRNVFGTAYNPAYPPLVILSTGYILFMCMNPVYETLKVIKKTKLIFLNSTISALLNLFINYLLIPEYGMIGGALSTIISMNVFALLGFIELRHYLKIKIFTVKYLYAISSITLAGLICKYFLSIVSLPKVATIISGISIIYGCYVIGLYLTACFEKEDIIILQAIKTKITRALML